MIHKLNHLSTIPAAPVCPTSTPSVCIDQKWVWWMQHSNYWTSYSIWCVHAPLLVRIVQLLLDGILDDGARGRQHLLVLLPHDLPQTLRELRLSGGLDPKLQIYWMRTYIPLDEFVVGIVGFLFVVAWCLRQHCCWVFGQLAWLRLRFQLLSLHAGKLQLTERFSLLNTKSILFMCTSSNYCRGISKNFTWSRGLSDATHKNCPGFGIMGVVFLPYNDPKRLPWSCRSVWPCFVYCSRTPDTWRWPTCDVQFCPTNGSQYCTDCSLYAILLYIYKYILFAVILYSPAASPTTKALRVCWARSSSSACSSELAGSRISWPRPPPTDSPSTPSRPNWCPHQSWRPTAATSRCQLRCPWRWSSWTPCHPLGSAGNRNAEIVVAARARRTQNCPGRFGP